MTPRLVRLRIAGFKSFAEPVSLDILPGLTGVVGPNGCGKSNVVEALRWAMGETSARSLRGGEMDDVIFAGTTARPSRNLAEVTITLERAGEEGTLPAPYEAEAELQVTRRIERGAGSQFRANGREVRARDVQTLYADLASGARSSGMVSQGRVSQLVNAKPEERRQVLEEAAGITGLHARRREAELKLRAAEANVTRAEDLRGQLAAAQEGLRKQARQAARYRNISGFIRAAEAEHLAVLFAQAQAALAAAEAGLAAAREDAAAAAQEIDISGQALAEAEAALPAVREAEAQARSTLERRRVEAESLAAEAARVARQAEEAQARLLELEADCEAAARGQADAAASVNRLDGEMRRLEAVLATLPDEVAATRKMLGERRAIAAAAQSAADSAEAAARDALAARHLAQEVFGAAEAREGERRDEHRRALSAQAAARDALVSEDALAAAADALREAEAGLVAARLAFEHAEAARAVAERTHLEARGRAGQARAEAAAARRAHAEILARATAAGEHCAQAEAVLARLQASRIAPALLAETALAAEAAQARLHASETALEAAEAEASAALAARAEAARKRDDLRAAQLRAEAALAQLAARLRAVEGEAERAGSAWAEAERLAPPDADISQAAAALAEAERAFAAGQAAMQRLQAGSTQAGLALAAAREAASQAEAEAAKYAAEAEGLRAAIGPPGDFATVLDSITVPEGLEAALGAALGDACTAALQDSANTFFRALPQPDDTALPLPPGAQRFEALMQAPPALSRIMAACVLLPAEADGDALQPDLPPGMVAVKPDGACWRWDGHTLRAGAPNAAATKLRQTNRLHAAERAMSRASAQAEAARAATEAASRDEATARNFLAASRDTLDHAERALREARTRSAALASRCAQADAQRTTLLPMVERLTAERGSTAQALQEARHALAAMPTPADTEAALSEAARLAGLATQAVESARIARAAARTQLATAQADAGRLRDQARDIEARIEGQTPLLARAHADHESALRQVAGSLEAMAALPDEAALATAETEAEAALRGAAQAQDASRANRKLAEDSLDSARAALSALTLAAAQARSQADAADALCARTAEDLDQAERQLRHAADQRAALPDHTALAQAAEAAIARRDATRAAAAEAESRLNRLEPELRQTEVARDLAVHDLAAWQNRLADAAGRATLLATRRDAARDAHKALADAPASFAARAEKSAANLHTAEATHRATNDRLHAAEQRVRGLALARRDAETHAAQKREAVLRSEASREAAATALAATLARAAERLGETAELPEARDIAPDSEERARKKLDRLTREREEMGPVNLRAELELEELDERLATLEQEREELTTAIAKLRASIGHLNREGRARLEAVFTEVDQHFRTLFTRMMGGGRAHLALTGSDDPLAAGLEIYAEPPGKKLASLSLLSGGEQALTALSLIFAVFRCTPAPISVLDEVDAPLDDANVERFCTLLDDVVRDTGTRFLVVTHHQLTMSRMDRLFGVTMQERGVSRLLSVDLQRAAAMVEPRLQAAE